MIERKRIEDLINENIQGTDLFLVELNITTSNKIDVFIDGLTGVSIKNCVGLSRHIEGALDREDEDFELNVSSPGAEQPFKVKEQYLKNIGRKINVLTVGGEQIQGILKKSDGQELTIERTEKRKKETGKGKILVTENINLELDKVKQASVILSFK